MAFPFASVTVSTNYKGGVGKTITSRVLAQGIADTPEFNKGKPVLVIDLDPQGNTSRRWNLLEGIEGPASGDMKPKPHPALDGQSSSACDLWLEFLDGGEGSSYQPEPYETANPLIHVVPADETLMRQVMKLPDTKAVALGNVMRTWLRSKEISDKYCYVIIDTAPSKSLLIDAALIAATHVYIPFIPEPQSAEGVLSIISYVSRFANSRGTDVPLNLLGLLPNLVKNTSLHKTYMRDLKRFAIGNYIMPVKLSNRIGYAETDAPGSTPDQVTTIKGTAIEHEAKMMIKYIVGKIEETMNPAQKAEAQ